MSGIAYVDASALVKLVLVEPESPAVYRWFREAPRIAASRIGVVETVRASSRREHDPAHRDQVLRDVEVIDLDAAIAGVAAAIAGVAAAIAGVAAAIAPAAIRTLDAIHLATALTLVPELDAFVTFDDRLADAARALGLPVVRPA